MEMTMRLLFEKDLTIFFWVEEVNTSTYLLNILSTKALTEKNTFWSMLNMEESLRWSISKYLVVYSILN